MKSTYSYIIRYISMVLLTLVGFTACDVHEFPELAADKIPTSFTLHLNFDTEMPLYKEVEYPSRAVNLYATSSTHPDDYDVRYIVEVYRADYSSRMTFSREAEQRIVVTGSTDGPLNRDIKLKLTSGEYRFIVWTDYVDKGSQADKFYDPTDFAEVKLRGEHCGSNDMRDAFCGTVDYVHTVEHGEATVEMSRPLAKFTFIANDLDSFITRILDYITKKEAEAQQKAMENGDEIDTRGENSTNGDPTRVINLDDYKVVFRYPRFMPSAYNLFRGHPASSSTGVVFESSMTELKDSEAQLGFDYVFVKDSNASVEVEVEVYDNEGTLLSRSSTITVPLERSKETIVRGKFLSHIAQGSVGISPEYDGDWNIEIP